MPQPAPRLGFESRLCRWLLASGGQVQDLTYARPGGGHCAAVHLMPATPWRGLVITAHATGNDKYFAFAAIYRALLTAGFAIFAFDLDGHGRHSRHVLSETHAASMLPSAIAAATPLAQGKPMHLLGQSLGALLCLHYLRTSSTAATINAAVCLSAPLSGRIGERRLGGEVRAILTRSWWRALGDYGPWEIWPAIGVFRRARYPLRHPASRDGRNVAGYIDLVDRLSATLASAGGKPACQVLLMYGSWDAVTPPAQAADLKVQLGNAARLLVIPRQTHFTLPLAESAITTIVDFFVAAST